MAGTILQTQRYPEMNHVLPSSRERVPAHTPTIVNRRLRRQADERLKHFAKHKSQITSRLTELDREWDIERAIELNASAFAFSGIVLGVTVDKRWLALPALVTIFLFQHAIQGWCPPVPVLRRLGFRTVYEIEDERHALNDLRSTSASPPKNGKK